MAGEPAIKRRSTELSESGSTTSLMAEIEDLFNEKLEARENMQKQALEQSNKELLRSLTGATHAIVGKMAKRVDKVEHCQQQIRGDLEEHRKDTETRFKKLESELSDARSALRLAQKVEVTDKDIRDSDFAREEDPTVLKLGTAVIVKRVDLLPVVQKWLTDADLSEEQWALKGPTEGTKFHIQFLGTAGLAAVAARDANFHLRGPEGVWQHFDVPAKDDSAKTRLFIGPDKSDQRITLERFAKRVIAAIKSTGKTAGKPVTATRPEKGEVFVSVSQVLVARVVAPTRQDAKVAYDDEALATFALAREIVQEAFESTAPPSLATKVAGATFSF